jgi:hypothetical protein
MTGHALLALPRQKSAKRCKVLGTVAKSRRDDRNAIHVAAPRMAPKACFGRRNQEIRCMHSERPKDKTLWLD